MITRAQTVTTTLVNPRVFMEKSSVIAGRGISSSLASGLPLNNFSAFWEVFPINQFRSSSFGHYNVMKTYIYSSAKEILKMTLR